MKTLFLCLIALLVAPLSFGADASHEHHGSPMNAAQAELGACAAFDADGVLWAVHKVSGHIAVSRSPDQGRSWSNPVLVTATPESTDTGGDARPKIATGPRGELYVTWTRPLSKPYTGEVKFSRSLDGGRTFSVPIVVHHDRQEITHRFDALMVTPRGQIFIAWIDKRDGAMAAATNAPPYRGAAVYFAVSDDRGATFRGDFRAAEHSCECCRIALVPNSDGTVTAMWRHIFAPNIRDHAIAILHADGSVTGMRRATFDDWHIDACPHHGPGIAEDAGGHLHAVWFTAAPERQGVFYGRLREDGVDGLRRIGGETAEHPDIAAAGRRVAVAWKEFDGERTRLRGMVSDDAGTTWHKPKDLAATSGASDHPRVLSQHGQFYVFWNTHNEPLIVAPLP